MGSLNDKLDATASSKEAIKNAISSKGGIINDSTPLSQYDDIINSFEILTPTMKNNLDQLYKRNNDSYETLTNTIINNLSSNNDTYKNLVYPNYSYSYNYKIQNLQELNTINYSYINQIVKEIKRIDSTKSPSENLASILQALKNIN